MPAAKPLEFPRRAVELARSKVKPVREIAADLGIAESCLRRALYPSRPSSMSTLSASRIMFSPGPQVPGRGGHPSWRRRCRTAGRLG